MSLMLVWLVWLDASAGTFNELETAARRSLENRRKSRKAYEPGDNDAESPGVELGQPGHTVTALGNGGTLYATVFCGGMPMAEIGIAAKSDRAEAL